MRFRITPLEERIALDAAALTQILEETETLDALDLSVEQAPQNALFIANNIGDVVTLHDAVLPTVQSTVYSSGSSLSALTESFTLQTPVKRLGLVTEAEAGELHLAEGVTISLATMETPDVVAFWQHIGAQIEEGGQLDLLGCCLAASEEGRALLQAIEDATGRVVNASDDITGMGGDWHLEYGNQAVDTLYFDADALALWHDQLGSPSLEDPSQAPLVAGEVFTLDQETLHWSAPSSYSATTTYAAGDVVAYDQGGLLVEGSIYFQTPTAIPATATLEMWSKVTSESTTLFNLGSMSVSVQEGELSIAWLHGNASVYDNHTGVLLPAEQWNHVAMSYDATSVTLFLNGKEVYHAEGEIHPNSFTNHAPQLQLAGAGDGNHYDAIRLWQTQRTEQEIFHNQYRTLSAQSDLVMDLGFDTASIDPRTGSNEPAPSSAYSRTEGAPALPDPLYIARQTSLGSNPLDNPLDWELVQPVTPQVWDATQTITQGSMVSMPIEYASFDGDALLFAEGWQHLNGADAWTLTMGLQERSGGQEQVLLQNDGVFSIGIDAQEHLWYAFVEGGQWVKTVTDVPIASAGADAFQITFDAGDVTVTNAQGYSHTATVATTQMASSTAGAWLGGTLTGSNYTGGMHYLHLWDRAETASLLGVVPPTETALVSAVHFSDMAADTLYDRVSGQAVGALTPAQAPTVTRALVPPLTYVATTEMAALESWQSTTTYEVGALVAHQGDLYRLYAPATQEPATDPAWGKVDPATLAGWTLVPETLVALPVTYVEGGDPIAIATTFTIEDLDATLQSTTVQVGGGWPGDTLTVTEPGGLSVAYDPQSMTLTLTGEASGQSYQSALRSLQFSSTSAYSATRTITIDADSSSTLTIMGVSQLDPPVQTATTSPLAVDEGGQPQLLFSDLLLQDSDSSALTFAQITLSSYQEGDQLSITLPPELTWSGADGTYAITGDASVAVYQAALQTLHYSTSAIHPTTEKVVTLTVHDTDLASNALARSIAVTDVLNPATATFATPDIFHEGDDPITLFPAITLVDPDDATLSLQRVTLAFEEYQMGDTIMVPQSVLIGATTYTEGVHYTATPDTVGGWTLEVQFPFLWEPLLEQLQYTFSGDDPMTEKTVVLALHDSSGTIGTHTQTFSLVPINDPVVGQWGELPTMTEGESSHIVAPNLTLEDDALSAISSMQVIITEGYEEGDLFSVTPVEEMGVTVGPGQITLTGALTPATYQTVLRSLTFDHTSEQPQEKTLELRITDGGQERVLATTLFTIAQVDDPTQFENVYSAPIQFLPQGGTWMDLDPSITAADVDDTSQPLTVTLDSNAPTGDLVRIQQPDGVWQEGRTLTLDQSAFADFDALNATLRTLAFRSNSVATAYESEPLTVTVAIGSVEHTYTLDKVAPEEHQIPNIYVTPYKEDMFGDTMSFTYREGQRYTLFDQVSLFDSDSYTKATIRIASGYQTLDRFDVDPIAAPITTTFDAATQTFTLAGRATAAQWSSALRQVHYSADEGPIAGPKTLDITLFDAFGRATNTTTFTMAVQEVDDPLEFIVEDPLVYQEGGGAQYLFPTVVVDDVEGDIPSYIQVTVMDGQEEDLLTLAGEWPYTVETGAQNVAVPVTQEDGTILAVDQFRTWVTLRDPTPEATIETVQELFRSLQFINTSEDPGATRDIRVMINAAPTFIDTNYTLTINTVDTPSTLHWDYSDSYIQSDAPVTIGGGFTISDPDGGTLSNATIQITPATFASGDLLTVADTQGLSTTYNAATGILTLDGAATLETYTTALQSLQFASDGAIGTRTLTAQLHTAEGVATDPVSIDFSIVANTPPVVQEEAPDPFDGQQSYSAGETATLDGVTYVKIDGDPPTVVSDLGDAIAVGEQIAWEGDLIMYNGTDTRVVVADSPSFTLDSSFATQAIFLSTGSGAGTLMEKEGSFAIRWDENGQVLLAIEDDALQGDPLATGVHLAEGMPHWISVAYENGSVTLQLSVLGPPDEVAGLGGTFTYTGSGVRSATSGALYIGADAAGTSYFSGMIDQVGLWSRADGVVPYTDQQYLQGIEPGLLGYWAFDESGGSVAHDITDHGHHATIEGQVSWAGMSAPSTRTYEALIAMPQATAWSTQSYAEGDRIIYNGDVYYASSAIDSQLDPSQEAAWIKEDPYLQRERWGRVSMAGEGDPQVSAQWQPLQEQYVAENTTPLYFGLGVVVNDTDHSQLQGLQVQIDNFQMGDQLSFSAQDGIDGSYDAESGLLTLHGQAPIASYQAVVRSLHYTASGLTLPVTKSITMTVDDGIDTTSVTKSFEADAFVQPPSTISSMEGSSVVEGGSVLPFFPSPTITTESSMLTALKVEVVEGWDEGDILAVGRSNGLTVDFDSTTHTLTLSGSASVATYLSSLSSVVFQAGSDDPTTTKELRLSVHDGVRYGYPQTTTLTVLAQDDPTVITTGVTAPLTYTEDAPAITPFATLTLDDPDTATLQSAQIVVQGATAHDHLAITQAQGLTWAWSNGTLSLEGAASLEVYQSALQSVVFSSSDQNPSGGRSLVVSVTTDQGAVETAPPVSITLVAQNDAPTLGALPIAQWIEGVPFTPFATAALGDVDDTNITGMTVVWSSGFETGDHFTWTLPSGIEAEIDATTITFTGTASVQAYEEVLRSMTMVPGQDNPTTVKTVRITIEDGIATSAPAYATLYMAPITTMEIEPGSYTAHAGPITWMEGVVTLTEPLDVDLLAPAGFSSVDGLGSGGTVEAGTKLVSYLLHIDPQSALNSVAEVTLPGTIVGISYTDSALAPLDTHFGVTPPQRGFLAEGDADVLAVSPDGTRVTMRSQGTDVDQVRVFVAYQPPASTFTTAPIVEEGGAQQLFSQATLQPFHQTTLERVTVRISEGEQAGDSLSVAPVDGLTVTLDAGVLTLEGTASLDTYTTALASLTLDPDAEPLAHKALTLEIDDGITTTTEVVALPITLVDDPMTIGGLAPATYVEGQPPVALFPFLTLEDSDTATLTGARVVCTSGYAIEDQLTWVEQPGITAHYAGDTLTFVGTATLLEYQALLRSVTYASQSDTPTAEKVLTLEVGEGSATVALSITAVDDAPTVTWGQSTVNYLERSGAQSIASDATLVDVDSTTLTTLTLQIASGYQEGDFLSVTEQGGITGAWDGETATLTLTGSASVAQYQSVLRSLQFTSTSYTPTAQKTIAVASAETTEDLTVVMLATNEVPIVTIEGESHYTEGDAAIVLDATATLTDHDHFFLSKLEVQIATGWQVGDRLEAESIGLLTSSYNSSSGILTVTGTGSLLDYQSVLRTVRFVTTEPAPNITKELNVRVYDADNGLGTAQHTVHITPLNAPPVLQFQSTQSYGENSPAIALFEMVTLSDPDSAAITTLSITATDGWESEDTLTWEDQPGITANYSAETGQLTFTGATTPFVYKTLLESVRFSSTSATPTTAKTFSVVVADETDTSTPLQLNLSVTPYDNPLEVGGIADVEWIQHGGPIALFPTLTLTDVDSMTVEQIRLVTPPTVTITFPDALGITASSSEDWKGDIVWTLSAGATPDQYQTFLRQVHFDYEADTFPENIAVTLLFDARDGGTIETQERVITVDLIDINDPPTLTLPGSNTWVQDRTTPTPLPALTLSDLENTLEGITLRVDGAATGDTVDYATALADSMGVDVTWDGGILTVTGTASVEQYQALYDSFTFATTNYLSGHQRSLEVVVHDHEFASDPQPLSVTFLNEAPVVQVEGTSLHYQENAAPLALFSNATLSDLDHTELQQMQLVITSGRTVEHDQITFTTDPALQLEHIFDATSNTHTYTFVGSASLQTYTNVLQSAQFSIDADAAIAGNHTVTVHVSDGMATTTLQRVVDVTEVFDPMQVHDPQTTVAFEEGIVISSVHLMRQAEVYNPDAAYLTRFEVQIIEGYNHSHDILAGPTGTSEFDTASGTLRLYGLDDISSVLFTSTDNNPQDKTVEIRVYSWKGSNHYVSSYTKTIDVTGENDLPEVQATDQSVTANYRAPISTLVTQGTFFSDVDSPQLQYGIVHIPQLPASYSLAVPDLPPGVTASVTQNSIALSGDVSIATLQFAMNQIYLEGTATENFSGDILFKAVDDHGDVATVTRTLTIDVEGQLPEATIPTTVQYAQWSNAQLLFPTAQLADVDSVVLQGAQLQIVAGEQASDSLGLVEGYTPPIDVTILSTSITIGEGTVEQVQDVLQHLTFQTYEPTVTNKTLTLTLYDDFETQPQHYTVDVQVNQVDDPLRLTLDATLPETVENKRGELLETTLFGVSRIEDRDSTISSMHLTLELSDVDHFSLYSAINLGPITVDKISDTEWLFTGEASTQQYQTILQNIRVQGVTEGQTNAHATATVLNQEGQSQTLERDFLLAAINYAPAITTLTTNTTSYAIGDPDIEPIESVVFSDVDDTTITKIEVQIEQGYQWGDRLDIASITSGKVYDTTTGILTVTGEWSHAEAATLLTSLTFASDNLSPNTTKTLTVALQDQYDMSAPVSIDLTTSVASDYFALQTDGASHAIHYDTVVTLPLLPDLTLTTTTAHTIQSAQVTLDMPQGYTLGIAALPDGLQWESNENGGILTGDADIALYHAWLAQLTLNGVGYEGVVQPQLTLLHDGGRAVLDTTVEITFVNEAPQLIIPSEEVPYHYHEGFFAIQFLADTTVEDYDHTHLQQAQIRLTPENGYLAGKDQLRIENVPSTLTCTHTEDENGIVLTLTGEAPLADYQAALHGASFSVEGDYDLAGPRTFTITLDDGQTQSAVFQRILHVEEVYDPPTLTVAPHTVTEYDTQVPLFQESVLTTYEDDQITSIVVMLDVGYQEGIDFLSATDSGGITTTFDAESGTLTLAGSGSVEEYQAVLRSSTYRVTDYQAYISKRLSVQVHTNLGSTIEQIVTPLDLDLDQPLQLLGTQTPLTWIENSAPVHPLSDWTVSDDDIFVDQVTITITGFQSAHDQVTVGTFTSDVAVQTALDGSTYTITAIGRAPRQEYSAFLRALTFEAPAEHSLAGVRSFHVEVERGEEPTVVLQRSLEVVEVYDAPTLTLPTTLDYEEGGVLLAPSGGMTYIDVGAVQEVVVRIETGYAPGDDQLTATLSEGFTQNFDNEQGTLTLTGSGSAADYQALLQTVRFTTLDAQFDGEKTVTYYVKTEGGEGYVATQTLEIDRPPRVVLAHNSSLWQENDPPIAPFHNSVISEYHPITKMQLRITGATQHDTWDFEGLSPTVTHADGVTVLTFDQEASAEVYQQVLRSAQFSVDAETDLGTQREVTLTVQSGDHSVTQSHTIGITSVWDPMQIMEYSPTHTVLEGSAVHLLPNIVLNSYEAEPLTQVTVVFTQGHTPLLDQLTLAPTPLTTAFDATTGTLTLSGSNDVALYQAALRTLQYHTTSTTPMKEVQLQFVQGEHTEAITLDLLVNQKVVITGHNTPLTWVEDSQPLTPLDGIQLQDTQETLAAIRLQVEGHHPLDQWQYVSQGLDVQSSSTVHHLDNSLTLTITGEGSVAAYQALLRSLTFHNTSQNGMAGTRTLSVEIYDGLQWSEPFTRGIAVEEVYDPPTIDGLQTDVTLATQGQAFYPLSSITLMEQDPVTVTGATLRFEEGVGDLLTLPSTEWDVTTVEGGLQITGTGSLVSYQSLLRHITLQSTATQPVPSKPFHTTLHLEDRPDITIEQTVHFAWANSSTTVEADPFATTVGLGDAVLLTPLENITLDDVDSVEIEKITVTLAQWPEGYQFVAPTDALAVESGPRTLTLGGSTDLARYQDFLRAIQIEGVATQSVQAPVHLSVHHLNGSVLETLIEGSVTLDYTPVTVDGTTSVTIEQWSDPVALFQGWDLTEGSLEELTRMHIAIAAGYQLGDTFNVDGHGLTVESGTGTLTITGTASAQTYASILQSITFDSTAQTTEDRTLTITLDNGYIPSHHTTTLLVTPQPYPLHVEGATPTWTQWSAPVALFENWQITPGKVDQIDGMEVAIIGGQQQYDLLEIDAPGWSVTTIPAGIRIEGAGSIAQYEALLQQVHFHSGSADSGDRTVQLRLWDSVSVTQNSTTLTILPVDDPITILEQEPFVNAITVPEGASHQFSPLQGVRIQDRDTPIDRVDITLSGGQQWFLTFEGSVPPATAWTQHSAHHWQIAGSDINTFLEQVRITSTMADTPTTLQIELTAINDIGQSTNHTRTVTIDIDAPVVMQLESSATYTPGTSPLHPLASLTLDDPDASAITQIDVVLENSPPGVSLVASDPTLQHAANHIRLIGLASRSDYESALRSIVYQVDHLTTLAPQTVTITLAQEGVEPHTITQTVETVLADSVALTTANMQLSRIGEGPLELAPLALRIEHFYGPTATLDISINSGHLLENGNVVAQNQLSLTGSVQELQEQFTHFSVAGEGEVALSLHLHGTQPAIFSQTQTIRLVWESASVIAQESRFHMVDAIAHLHQIEPQAYQPLYTPLLPMLQKQFTSASDMFEKIEWSLIGSDLHFKKEDLLEPTLSDEHVPSTLDPTHDT